MGSFKTMSVAILKLKRQFLFGRFDVLEANRKALLLANLFSLKKKTSSRGTSERLLPRLCLKGTFETKEPYVTLPQ